LAGELRAQGIPVFSRLEQIVEKPDLVHGNHYIETLDALRHFRDIPGLFLCHDRLSWQDAPPRHPSLGLYVAVDHNCRERLLEASWMDPNRVEVVENAVDLSRFTPRERRLPVKPERALVFSNNAGPDTYLEALQDACAREGIRLDIAGSGVGCEVRAPEHLLPRYDLVFAKARCALEAMAVGSAVILCDRRGLGPMVKRREVEELRRWNFGMRLLSHPVDADDIIKRIREYDPSDAREVSTYIRSSAGLEIALAKYCRLYGRLRKGFEKPAALPPACIPTRLIDRHDQALLRVRIRTRLERIRPGEEFYVSVQIRRWTTKPVVTESPWPILLSYRWYDEDGSRVVHNEGIHSPVVPPVRWGWGGDYNMRIIAPGRAGHYRLRVTLVQEHWKWLDERRPRVFVERSVTIQGEKRAFYTRG